MARLKLEKIKEELILHSWLYLAGEYENLDSELELQCPEGHRTFTSLRAWRRKKHCPVCHKNKAKTKKEAIGVVEQDRKFKRILSLDASTNITGWAIFDGYELMNYGKFTTTKRDTVQRIAHINEWLVTVIDQWSPDLVVIEDIQKQINPKTFKVLANLQGVLVNTVFMNGIDIKMVTASQWRSGVGVKGQNRKALKKCAIDLVKEWYNIDVGEDEADAICLGRHISYNKLKNDFFEWET